MKIQLSTPTRGQLDHEHLECVDELIGLARHPEADFRMTIVRMFGCSLLDHARSRMATNFLESDADVLLWVDDDMVFDANECLRLCREAFERRTIVGAVCSTRGVMGKLTAKFGPEVTKLGFFSEGGIHEAISIGCGLTAVHREVFEKLADSGSVPRCNTAGEGNTNSIFPFYMTLVEDGLWWGEDTSFCIRARREGFSVLVDTRARVGHKGSYVYHVEDTSSAIKLYRGLTANIVQPEQSEKAAE
jgi:hypothetical protein